MKQLPLTRGHFALVDDEDFEFLHQYKWHYTENKRGYPYAIRNVGNTTQRMHRLLLNPPKGMDVDHKNGFGLDNRRTNIWVCTRSQNQMNRKSGSNSSGVPGVHWRKRSKRYEVDITLNRKNIYIGFFRTLNEAKIARALAEHKYHGHPLRV